MIDYLIVHSTSTEKGKNVDKREYKLLVSCDVVQLNGQLSRHEVEKSEHPTSEDNYKHIAYVGGIEDGNVTDTATWKQYDSLEHIVMYHLLYNQNLKVGCASLFFDTDSGLGVRQWLEDIGVKPKNIM